QVTVEMSEPIDPISVNSNTFYIQSESKKIAGKSTLDQDGKTLRFIADSVFSVGKIHYVYLQSIKDINGNITDYYRNTSFTTTTDEDKTAPTLKSTSIKAEQIDVPINTRLQVEFDEPINSISLKNIRLKNNDDDTINVTRTLSSDKKIITIQPTDPLKANSDYQLIIENIQDLSGNVLEKALTLSFTTESGAETLAGKVASFIPENQAVDVDVETGIIVKFNRVINPVSITDKSFIIQDAEKSSDIAGTRTLSKDGLTLTFTPTKLFTEKQRYIVRISYHANNYLTDLTGENILATSFSFTTK
ncbi:MAG: Ig-like domain-containing protein, partial [Methylococcales bacterium]|nr:Ig-like domain-containing protein [Methylococcales bacterium]